MPPPFRLAIIADAHFHDPAGDFGGAGIDLGQGPRVLRHWHDTRAAIRAVNESGMALTAALDRIVGMGITHVILAGDYSDDGQAETVLRLAGLLHGYHQRHGLVFHAIPGNHDAHASHGKHVSARIAATDGTTLLTSNPMQDQGGTSTPAMRCLGLPAALAPMSAFGLFRQPHHRHWESPFGTDDAPEARMYGATSANGSVTHRLMDASYLAEPEPGLWLLMPDANVWEPRSGRTDPRRKQTFLDAAEAGWPAVLRVKPHLLPWIADVTARARAQGKVLVTVSHYPVLDPFLPDGGAEAALTPASSLARRTPGPGVGQALAACGLRWHAGGHLHLCRANRLETVHGSLTDLSLPSLVSFPPGFTVIEADAQGIAAVPVSLADLPPDPALTALYGAQGRGDPPLPYGAFLAAQFRERVRTVRLPRDWPREVLGWMQDRHAGDLARLLDHSARSEAALSACSLADLAADFYLLRDGGGLAAGHVAPERLRLCRMLARHADPLAEPAASVASFWRRFLSILPR